MAEVNNDRSITYVNIRETAGWSKDADGAGPKMERSSPRRRSLFPTFRS